jgi:arylsulfatase A-like enzyme
MNVLLLVYDSVRPDYLAPYNAARVGQDGLLDIAREGALFESVVSTSAWTLPAVSGIVSGVYSHKLGLYKWDQPWPDDYTTLFHRFKEAGYNVGSFVFEPQFLFPSVPAAGVVDHSRDPSRICDWIRENAGSKFFLLVHSHRTHIPWVVQHSAESWRKEVRRLQEVLRENGEEGAAECRALYEDSIRAMSEEEIPSFREALRDAGVEDDTLIVFTADHGESWCERITDRETITDNFALHGRFLYDECVLTPLIIRSPEGRWAGERVRGQVRSVDIAPTVLDLCGIKYDFESMDGRSLVEPLEKGEGADRPALSSTTDTVNTKHLTVLAKMSLRRPPWKLIKSLFDDTWELYDLEKDPGETENLYAEHSGGDTVAEMVSVIEEHVKQIKPFEGGEEEEEKLREQLRGLGYL